MSQDPSAKEAVPKDGIIRVAVSAGPRRVMLPDVVNMTGEEARELLEAQGLAVTVSEAYSDTVEVGRVISQSVESGEVDEGTAVTLEVSLGEQPPETTRAAQPTRQNPTPNPNRNPSAQTQPAQTQPAQTQPAPTQPPQTQPAPTQAPETAAPSGGGSGNPFVDFRNDAINNNQ